MYVINDGCSVRDIPSAIQLQSEAHHADVQHLQDPPLAPIA